MKVALVCDFLTKFGGAQQVLLALHEIYPDAPIHCLLYDEIGTKGKFKGCEIIQSSLQKKPRFLRVRPKLLLGGLAKAIEEFDFSKYDIVISSSDSYAHGIITKPTTFHLCYCHTPMRYAWDWHNEYLKENNIGFGLKGLIVRNFIHQIRLWDRAAADRVDHWMSNSANVKGRIRKYYQSEATVVYPPIETEQIKPSDKMHENYYLVVSRLEPYKRIKLAVEAFNQNTKKLIVVGEGSELPELRRIAKNNIEFVPFKTGEPLYEYFRNCKAFLFPGEDDFGMTPVEAMAAGRPVIAYGKGGTLESITDGKTGLFFDQPTAESLNEAVRLLEKNYNDFTVEACVKRAAEFSKENFKSKILEIVEREYGAYKKRLGL